MHRRALLTAALAAPVLATPALAGLGLPSPARAATPPAGPGWRRFEIATRVVLPDAPGPARLWLPVPQTAPGYQVAQAPAWTTGGRAALVHDARYGAPVLRADWNAATPAPRRIAVTQKVLVRDRDAVTLPGTPPGTGPGATPAAAPLDPAGRRFWTAPTESLPTDGIVRDTALRVVGARTAPRDRLRALYDWVVDSTTRDPATPGCGTGDIRAMLQSGHPGGKCADINGLMVGLARAAGLPARDVYGTRVAASRLYPSLGRAGDVSLAQHCRAEVFLEGEGWFPVDPADVRKVVLEGRVPLDAEAGRALRERMFGRWEMNWVGFNSATDIVLPGAGPGEVPNFPFLMYPCAFTAAGQSDCLDPAHFHYEVHARELAV